MSLGKVLGPVPEEDHGRTCALALGQQRAEVGVGRNQDSVLAGGTFEDHVVGGGFQPDVTHVDGVMSSDAKSLSHAWREGVVDQDLQS